jgi:hypothetical protein
MFMLRIRFDTSRSARRVPGSAGESASGHGVGCAPLLFQLFRRCLSDFFADMLDGV